MYKGNDEMAITRQWFINIGGCDCDILEESNYVNVKIFPSCLVNGHTICAVAGLYSPTTNGSNPAPFSNNLLTYIIEAKAMLTAKPNGAGQKRYVYVTSYD
jgi:hypothetical protein